MRALSDADAPVTERALPADAEGPDGGRERVPPAEHLLEETTGVKARGKRASVERAGTARGRKDSRRGNPPPHITFSPYGGVRPW